MLRIIMKILFWIGLALTIVMLISMFGDRAVGWTWIIIALVCIIPVAVYEIIQSRRNKK